MKTFSKLALLALLSAGVAVPALVAPAAAAKKEEKPGAKFSPDFIKVAKPAQDAIAAKDYATAETNIVAAEAAAKTDDDKYTAAALRYDLEQSKIVAARTANPNAPVDESRLAAPMTALIASPNTPADAKGRFAFRLGVLNYNAKQWATAIAYLQQAQQLGYSDPNLPLQIAQARVQSGDVQGGLRDVDAVIQKANAAGQKAPEDYYRYAIGKANQSKNRAETVNWLTRYVAAYPTEKNWRDVIIMYGIQQGSVATLDKEQQIDLFRLMRATRSLGDQSLYEQYAQTTRVRGLPAETVSVLQEGVASGKLPAANAFVKTSLTEAQASARAEGSLSGLETKAKAGANGKLAAQTGDAYLSQSNWTKAAELYRLALTKGGVVEDEVNTHLGIALARAGDKAGAQAAFGQVKGQPRADIAALWTAYLNQSAA